jgi:amidase
MASRIDLATFSAALTRRATLVRRWQAFLARYAVLIVPVCGELPFADNLDLADDASYARVWRAQMPQVGLPLIGVPALTVSTGMAGSAPVGVQVVAARFREDLCLLAGEAIEAGGTPPAPIDPVGAA